MLIRVLHIYVCTYVHVCICDLFMNLELLKMWYTTALAIQVLFPCLLYWVSMLIW